MFCLLVIIAPLVLLSAGEAEKRHLYVKPTPTSSGCPQDEVCMTLSDYLQNVSDYFTSNTAFHLLCGNHSIESSHKDDHLLVSSVNNLSLSGYGGGTTLHCAEAFGFAFVNITNLHISDIRIIHCGQATIANVLKITKIVSVAMPTSTKAALTLVNLESLVLHNVEIKASYGYGLIGVNVFGNSTITNCTFTHNMWRSDDINTGNTLNHSYAENGPGGNALFIYTHYISQQKYQYTDVLHISQCEFAHGINTNKFDFPRWIDSRSTLFSWGSGLGIFVKFTSYYNLQFMKINITNSIFHHNNAPHGPGGNVFILRHVSKITATIDISNCTFYDGKAVQGGGIFIGSRSAITDFTVSDKQFVVKLSNSTITNNSARSGGGLSIKTNQQRIQILLENCMLSNNKAIHGAAVHIAGYVDWKPKPKPIHFIGLATEISLTYSSSFNTPIEILGPSVYINVTQTTFLQNIAAESGGGIDIDCFMFTVKERIQLTLDVGSVEVICSNCNFVENKAESGYAVNINNCNYKQDPNLYNNYIRQISTYNPLPLFSFTTQTYRILISFFNTTVTNNRAYRHKKDHCTAVFCIHNTDKVLLSNSVFVGNNGSALYINGSNLHISGVVNITDNHGVSGGGLYFDCNPRSFLYLTPHSQLYLANNTASLHGGAMAAQDCSAQTNKTKCFIQIFDEDEECSSFFDKTTPINESLTCSDTKVILENNTAEVAGDSIYGGSLDWCYMVGDNGDKWIYFRTLQTRILKIRNKLSSSEIASAPFQVCFCHENVGPKCINETQAEVYHGQTLRIPAITAGQFNNASPALVRTAITSDQSGILLGERQKFQELGRDCGSLVYLFNLSKKQVSNFDLQISIERSTIKNFSAVVHVVVFNCPPGFELSSDLSICQCEPHLKIYGIKCYIDTQKFSRPAPMWIGYYREEQVTVHTNCPFHYCKSEENEFTLDNQDDQCASNHSGVLCGACQQGLSLALGTSQCLKCSNVYLLLLIPFALAGVALVFLLLKCNLTVSVGSINGLIFYANIIQVNHPTFFPQGTKGMNLLTKFLSVFIGWMNLDFGIQTCFFTGMTAYTKTWFQFAFPAYVWIMVGFMIYGSRHFPTVSRLIGSNAVQVLATLFLLSYAKLLRTVIATVYSTTLKGRNSYTPLVWLLDGNVLFLRGPHIALLLMALVVILVYIIPFTTLVLLAPCLQSHSNYRLLRLVNIKLKPLLDAYQGPYKDKFRYWTGLMLLLRVVLFIVFAGNVLGKPEINLFAVIVSILLLVAFYWNAGGVYKKALWNTTESFYLLNLAVLSAANSLIRSLEAPRSQELVTDVMIGTAFAVFCAIILYHFCVYLWKTPVARINIKQTVQNFLRLKLYNKQQPTIGSANPIANPNTNGVASNTHTVSHINIELNQLREPLLSGTN